MNLFFGFIKGLFFILTGLDAHLEKELKEEARKKYPGMKPPTKCECGRPIQDVMKIRLNGHTHTVRFNSTWVAPKVCERCLEKRVIPCAFTGKPIMPGDFVALYPEMAWNTVPNTKYIGGYTVVSAQAAKGAVDVCGIWTGKEISMMSDDERVSYTDWPVDNNPGSIH